MKVTVIGTGSIGKRHLEVISKLSSKYDIKEISSFDTNNQRTDEVLKKIDNVKVYDSLEEAVFGSTIVFICVPTSLHIEVWKQIKKYGDFNYFIEKPLSHNLAGCDKMIFEQKERKNA